MSRTETVVRVAARGDGVTESGRHIALAAPGDLVSEDRITTLGPHHAVPPCRHFPQCGGCQLQHLDDAAYGGFLVDRIITALAAQDIAAPQMRDPLISPPRTRRRASLSAERRGSQLLLGFSAEASHRIIDMRECHILLPALFDLAAPLRTLLGRMVRPRRRATVRLTLADQGVDMLLQNVQSEGLEAAEALADFARAHRLARLAIDEGLGPTSLWEPEPVTVALGGVPVPLPHESFLQATAEGETALVEAVREGVGDAATIADLFAGLGTFALSLGGRILAVEGARDVVLALKTAANRTQRPISVEHRDLFRRPLDGKELDRFEVVVLDPPRAGAKDQIALIAGSRVPRIVYVSCNPVTFARDAKALLAGGYRFQWVRPVGQFRWSTHVELAAAFAR